MTRTSMKRTLRRAYFSLSVVLAVALVAKLADLVPGVAGTPWATLAADIYDWLRDMSLVFVTVVAAYLANVFQKRSKFVESLEEVWRSIVATKSALFTFCEKQYPSSDDYLAAFCRLSETIDSMRIVYRNAGETDRTVGLYPYAPLHDMRRALQSIDPRQRPNIPLEERGLVRDAILQCFYALRETFLEELDLYEPAHPLLISGGRRQKQPGATRRARRLQEHQRSENGQLPPSRPEVDALLADLYALEFPGRRDAAGEPETGRS